MKDKLETIDEFNMSKGEAKNNEKSGRQNSPQLF
jgi:hypothetical protein